MIMKGSFIYPFSPSSEGDDTSSSTKSPETKQKDLVAMDEPEENAAVQGTFHPTSPIPITKVQSTVRRSRMPPRNQQSQIICDHANCKDKGLVFKRLCEWNKHMDRHERPYKCREPGCELSLGFTYSGGLLRHQREVHKMHQSTRQPLYCPFPYCNRSSGTGFTRRENLEEHKRRRHLEEISSAPNPTSNEPESAKTPTVSAKTLVGVRSMVPSTPQQQQQQQQHVQQAGSPLKRKRTSLPHDEISNGHQQSHQQVTTAHPTSRDASTSIASAPTQAAENEIRHLRSEIRRKDETIVRQLNELHRLQNLLRSLPPQTIYGVMPHNQPQLQTQASLMPSVGQTRVSSGGGSGGGGGG